MCPSCATFGTRNRPSAINDTMDYRREIDGLRALAVLPVILFHAGFETFSGGFVGVDVFFVISGYLITSIILSELEQGKYSIVNFYERRARRILPALFLVMLVCIPFAWFWLLPRDMKDFSQSLAAVSVFASNILFWRESGYFDKAAELKPLLHTWSLAVEEQFYVLFPLFLMLFWRLGKRWILILLAVVFVASLCVAQSLTHSQWGSLAKTAASFFLLPTRGWELLIGAFAAFYLSKANRTEFSRCVGEVGGWVGVALILYSVFAYSKATPFPGFYALVPTVGTVVIILFATQQTTVGNFLGNKAFVGVGLISYSAYLWHHPLFAFARHRSVSEPSHLVFAVLSIVSLILAYFSWRYVEAPFRNKEIHSRVRVFAYSIIGSFFFICVGLAGHFCDDKIESYWIERFPEKHRSFYTKLVSKYRSLSDFGAISDGEQKLSDCRFNVSNLNPETGQKIKSCYEKYGSGVLILGDSHAIDLFGVVASRFEDRFLVGVTNGGCRPHTPRPECQYDSVSSFVQKNKGVFNHVIYEQAGFYLLLDSRNNKGTRQMFSSLDYAESVDGISFDDNHIKATLDYLTELSTVVPVTWFLPRVEPHINKNTLLKSGCEYDWKLRPGLKETFLSLDKRIENVVKESSTQRIKTVSQNGVFVFSFPSDFLSCNDIYWSDADHLSSSGERLFGQRLPSDFLKF